MLPLTRPTRLLRRIARAFVTVLLRTRNTPAGEPDGYEAWLDESFAR